MPFTFKLSQRLARMRGAVLLLATAALAACEKPLSRVVGPTQPAAPVASLTVNPPSLTLTVGSIQQLSSVLKDASGNILTGRAVAWTSSSPTVATVNAAGLATGVATGAATVTATSEGQSGAASVTVNNVPVASVAVNPTSASVTVGQTLQLTATPKDANGNPLSGRAVTWMSSATGVAIVNGSGAVTGVAPSAATITATSEGKSGTATITVTATSGGTVLLQETFADSAFASRGWYDNTSMAITDTVHIVGSTHSLEIHFTVGATAPTWGGTARHLFQLTRSVYLSYWVKYSTTWVGSGQPYHPHEFYFLTNEDAAYAGPAFNYLTAYVEDNYQNGGIPVLSVQDGMNIDQTRIGVDLTKVTENRAVAGCNGNSDGYQTSCYAMGNGQYDNGKTWEASQPYFLPNPGAGYKNNWHFVEAYFQLNSIQNGIGVSDGIARYWVDRQLVIDHTNVLLRTGAHPNMMFNQLLIGPYIGSGSPVDQTMWVDNLTVATALP